MTKKNILLLFFIAFIVKIISCAWLVNLTKCDAETIVYGKLAIKSGDASSYLDPVDNLLNYGSFYNEINGEKVFMGRAPYYGAPYFFLRLFFNQTLSYNLLALLQIILECISILLISQVVCEILKKKSAFYFTYIFLLLSLNSTITSVYLQTESFAISFSVFFAYNYYKYISNERTIKRMLLSSCSLAVLCALKPYFFPIFFLIGFEYITFNKFNLKKTILNCFYFSIPLLIIFIPYGIRNFILFNKFQPLPDLYGGYKYDKTEFPMRNFIQSWGGSFVYWDKKAAASYFRPYAVGKSEFTFPKYAFCENGYDLKDLEELRDLNIRFNNGEKNLADSIANTFNNYTEMYKKSKPLYYYFFSRLINLKEFVIHSGSYYLPISKSSKCYHVYQFAIKILQSCLYYITLIFGYLGLYLGLKKNKKLIIFLIIPIYLILFFPLIFKISEWRYFDTSYPFLVFGTILFFNKMYKRLFLLFNKYYPKKLIN